jgi:alpha-N-arabinofuranosidase
MALNLPWTAKSGNRSRFPRLRHGRRHASKKLWLSFDEWNVWYRQRSGSDVDGNKTVAPHLLEEVYNLEDALLVGGLVNTLIRNSDRVKIACLAQLINVIAPIMTNESGFYRQSIYYPYAWALQYASGSAMNFVVESPTYEVTAIDARASRGDRAASEAVPYVDVSGTFDKATGKYSVFLFNRDLANARRVEILWEDAAPSRVRLLHAHRQ